jgi:hypothetical protein
MKVVEPCSAARRIHRPTRRSILLGTTVALLILASAANLAAQPRQPGKGGIAKNSVSAPSVHDIFPLEINPQTPVSELVPPLPTIQPGLEPTSAKETRDIPELSLQEPFSQTLSFGMGLKHMTHLVAKIKYLNQKSPDGFIQALAKYRPDLQGLPFHRDPDCQMSKECGPVFKQELDLLRWAMSPPPGSIAATYAACSKSLPVEERFWSIYESLIQTQTGGKGNDLARATRYGLLMHVLAPLPEVYRKGLVKHLAGTKHPASSWALVKLALFAPEAQVCAAAAAALHIRNEEDYADLLLAGLQYPWPEVAERAAAALIEADAADVVGKLVDLLEQPDPRLPTVAKKDGKEVYQVKQLVRLNHHQNCLLCHAPALPTDLLAPYVVTMPVSLPHRPLPVFPEQYDNPGSDHLQVRVDVTYLRPHFSLVLKAPGPKGWPELQRFDFLLRTLHMTKDQAQAYEAKLHALNGSAAPYQKAVLKALRSLTGMDAGTTAAAWRKALKKPG